MASLRGGPLIGAGLLTAVFLAFLAFLVGAAVAAAGAAAAAAAAGGATFAAGAAFAEGGTVPTATPAARLAAGEGTPCFAAFSSSAFTIFVASRPKASIMRDVPAAAAISTLCVESF